MKRLPALLPILLLTACGGSGKSTPPATSSTTTPVAETPQVQEQVQEPVIHFFPANNGSNSEQLWKTDGTEAGTEMVKVINASGSARIKVFGSMDGKAIFMARDGIHGDELWTTDGSEAGTQMLKDIHPGSNGTSINSFAFVENTMFFSAIDPVNGTELWKTDGTSAGTVLVKDIFTGVDGSDVDDIVVLGNTVYFSARDTAGAKKLWKSDGTEAGTVAIDGGAQYPVKMTVLDNTIYFRAYDATHGPELWKSDGTTAGTTVVKDIRPGSTGSSPISFVSMGGNMYFLAAESNAQGQELWRTDGTEAGTMLVKNINTKTNGSFQKNSSKIRYLKATSDKLYFTARPDSSVNVAELWVSDGTEAGTISLYNAGAISNQASVSDVIVTENAVYFDGYDATNGSELWKTDGTVAGTALFKDVVQGTGNSQFSSLGGYYKYASPSAPVLTLSDGSVLMAGYTPDKGLELWKTDGTVAGTVLVKDINPDAGNGLDS